jgi:hypothetical protein
LEDALRQIAGQNQRITQLEDRLDRLSQDIVALKAGANR